MDINLFLSCLCVFMRKGRDTRVFTTYFTCSIYLDPVVSIIAQDCFFEHWMALTISPKFTWLESCRARIELQLIWQPAILLLYHLETFRIKRFKWRDLPWALVTRHSSYKHYVQSRVLCSCWVSLAWDSFFFFLLRHDINIRCFLFFISNLSLTVMLKCNIYIEEYICQTSDVCIQHSDQGTGHHWSSRSHPHALFHHFPQAPEGALSDFSQHILILILHVIAVI